MQRMLDFNLVNSFRPCDVDKTHLSIIVLRWRERGEAALITFTTTSQHFLFEDCSTSAVPAHKREKQFLTHTHTHTHTPITVWKLIPSPWQSHSLPLSCGKHCKQADRAHRGTAYFISLAERESCTLRVRREIAGPIAVCGCFFNYVFVCFFGPLDFTK